MTAKKKASAKKTPAKRKKPGPRKPVDTVDGGSNRKAVEALLKKLPKDALDPARTQMLRSLATAVDTEPTNAQLWKQYRDALSDATEDDPDADSDLNEALAKIRGAASVGDAPKA